MIRFKQPNKRLLITAIVMITVGVAGLGFGIYRANTSQADMVSNKPNFTALVPASKTIEQLGGWEKLTGPNGDAFYVFTDNVSGVNVNVSQQKLPGKFKSDLNNEMLNLARAYNANLKIDAGETKVYIGTSAKGPQSVIFTKNGVLVLIKSWSTLENGDWIAYINSLE